MLFLPLAPKWGAVCRPVPACWPSGGHFQSTLTSVPNKAVTLFPSRVFKFEKIQQLTGAPRTPVPTPDFLFEIEYFDPANARFYETKGERDLIYAFHGSRLENFHSIIHNGLHCHLNKVGPGTRCRGAWCVCVCWIPVGGLLVESTCMGR